MGTGTKFPDSNWSACSTGDERIASSSLGVPADQREARRHRERWPSDPGRHAFPDGSRSHFLKVAIDVDTVSLLAELDAAPWAWLADTSRQHKVRCQRHTQSIFLRAVKKPFPPGATNANDVHESRATRMARCFPRTLAYCESVAYGLGGTLGRATLVALLPKSRVYPHVDTGEYYRIRDRFHLVLKSPGGSPLSAGNETTLMRPGELWVFDNKTRHSADNSSAEPRVHLIFDVLPPPGCGFFVPAPKRGRPVEVPRSASMPGA